MDYSNFTINESERKPGQHLQREDRGAIEKLHREGYSLRKIAKLINCSPSTVMYELRRGTVSRKPGRGRPPIYLAKRGHYVYKHNRKACHKPHKLDTCKSFVKWVVNAFHFNEWSIDACVGYARVNQLFSKSKMLSTKTMYNELRKGKLPITMFDVPYVLTRRRKKNYYRKNKRLKGRSIEQRPKIVDENSQFGHWEIDTVVGKRKGHEEVILSLIERITNNYLAFKISGKTSDAVNKAMEKLRETYGSKFNKVFKTITADNGSEFEKLAAIEKWGTKVYFTHPYSSYERAKNERHNGMLRKFVPKGVSIKCFRSEQILSFADKLNGLPRKLLNYKTPEELFDENLDKIYSNQK